VNYRNYSPIATILFPRLSYRKLFSFARSLSYCVQWDWWNWKFPSIDINREENSIDHRETGRPKSPSDFFFREKDGCVFFFKKRVWWSGHIWGRLEIWWNKKNKLLLLLLLRFQRLVYIFVSLHGVSTKSRFQRESLLFSASPAATTTPTTTNHQKTTTIDQKFFVSFGYWCCCCCPCCCRLTAKQIHHAGIISIELYLPD
jgi:hypothetical protein